MTKGKTTLIQKDTQKRYCSKQLQTHYVATDNVDNTKGTNNNNKLRTVPRRSERMPQLNKRNWRSIIYGSTHAQ